MTPTTACVWVVERLVPQHHLITSLSINVPPTTFPSEIIRVYGKNATAFVELATFLVRN